MQIPNSANVVPARSTAVLRRIADTIPTGKATASEIDHREERQLEARAQTAGSRSR